MFFKNSCGVFATLLLPVLVFFTGYLNAQCEVHIVPNSVIVIDHNPGISFVFEIQNDDVVSYTGGPLYMDWALSSFISGPIWEFNLNPIPILPGESRYISTPSFDIPLPENVPGNWSPYAGWTGSEYTSFKIGLDPIYSTNCYQWIFNEDGTLWTELLSDGCSNINGNNFCDDQCHVELVDYNLETEELTIIPYSTYCPNIGTPAWFNQYPYDDPYIFGFTLSFITDAGTINVNLGGQEIYASDTPITIDLGNGILSVILEPILEGINNGDFCELTLVLYNLNNTGQNINDVLPYQVIELINLCPIQIGGCTDPEAENYNPEATEDDGSCLYDLNLTLGGDIIWTTQGTCVNPSYNQTFIVNNTGEGVIDNFTLEVIVETWDGDIIYQSTDDYNVSIDPNDSYMVDDQPDIFTGDLNHVTATITWINELGETEEYSQSFNIILYCWGCTDPTANNYTESDYIFDSLPEHWLEAFPNTIPPTPEQVECTYDILGCTDLEANNYNPLSNVDDGSCTYDVLGCTNLEANNYNPLANIDDGSCTYDIFGCTDSFASNYNPIATVDDGSCVIYLGGCVDTTALNYNPQATEDDGSCVYDSCDGGYFAPNTFTPNNDGLNDGWSIVTDSECWLQWEILIFDRWGKLVWKSDIPGEVWEGSNSNGNHYVSDGIYVYTIKGVGYNPSHTFQKSGHITIFR
jgi:gliding motility-associated-like protein